MSRAAVALVGLVLLSGARAEASCRDVFGCFCGQGLEVGVATTEGLDGGSSVLRVDSANVGLDAGTKLSWAREPGELVGSRWLLLDGQRRPLDSSGNVTCEFLPEKPVEATAVARAASSPSTCEADLEALGYRQPPCNDNGPRCSVSPFLLSPLLVLAWLISRRSLKG